MTRSIGSIVILQVLLFFAVKHCTASDTTRVFYIGNSFVYTYDVPAVVQNFANLAGKGLYYEQHTPGGISVADAAQGSSAHWLNPAVFNTLRTGSWDFVVLQDNQGRFVLGHHKFPSLATSKVVEGHIKIRDSMRYYSPCAKMVLFAGWAFQGGYMPYSPTGVGLIDTIAINYAFLNDSMHEVISPIGIAWRRAIAMLPTVNLWGPDSAHQSAAGTYLTGAVIYSTIFRSSPIGLNYTAGLDSAVARTLRTIAWQTVSDSIVTNNLTLVTIPISQIGSTVAVSGTYTSFQWYRNDTLIPGATGAAVTGTNGACYSVTALDSDGCKCRSMPLCYVASTGISPAMPDCAFTVYPNPANDLLHVRVEAAGAHLTVTDINGREIAEHVLNTPETTLNTSAWNAGLYFVTTVSGEQVYKKKVVIHR
ncbi:MAG: hypothetical protein K0Q79_1200 [Flavipsychrobacter sp.]|jgi:hypothetical protein|nr:hypothetical protein [Flavipsychrobacter sp.]